MCAGPSWETIPFHFIWVSLTLLYGFRIWGLGLDGRRPRLVVAASTGLLILNDAFDGDQQWGELFEVPLMSAMFLAMVWHARRRQDALAKVERQARERAALLERQERFLHDVSHELRTPVTIARGHLEVLRRTGTVRSHEVDVALDELGRIERILERLLLLAKTDHPDFVVFAEIDLEVFLEDVLHALVRGRSARLATRPGARRRRYAPTPRRCESHSTRCSRTPSSTPRARRLDRARALAPTAPGS